MDISHNMTCNIVAETGRSDRFYMDMRVYDIDLISRNPWEANSDALIWRGIYLATEVRPGRKSSHPAL